MLEAEFETFRLMWEKLAADYGRPVVQNNFEYPYWRLMGNADASLACGRVSFTARLNLKFAEYAQNNSWFFINDINYLSAYFGLEALCDPFYWYMYKCAFSPAGEVRVAQSAANIIKAIYGKNKKALAVDLDGTLWGGSVGDDGADGVEIGRETPAGEAFFEFQEYVKAHKSLGVVLNVVSKNETANALAGLNRPDGALRPGDFAAIKANWRPKSENLADIAGELALLPESFVFVDDNPAERAIVNQVLPEVETPALTAPEHYIKTLDACAFFETTALTREDASRGDMYSENAARAKASARFTDYGQYLRSLEMTAEITPFSPVHFSRVAQLTNKSNQFNLTTLRLTREQIERLAADGRYITLCGKLADKFGDNGLVSVIAGEIAGETLHLRLWLMSCRVLKRDMERAMLNALARSAKERGLKTLYGYYYPTAKNGLVKNFYGDMGFSLAAEAPGGESEWVLPLEGYAPRPCFIAVNGEANRR